MEIKELSFMENLSGNGKEVVARKGLVGGHTSSSYSSSSSSDYYGYSSHPFFKEIIIDIDFGSIVIEAPQPEPEPVIFTAQALSSSIGIPIPNFLF